MATTPRNTLRQYVSERFNDRLTGTCSGAGNAGGTTVVDTALSDRDTDEFLNQFIVLPSGPTGTDAAGDANYASRRCSANTNAGTLTVYRAYGAPTQVASGAAYEIHKIDPDLKHRMINAAIRSVYPDIYLPIIDETLVVDNLLTNGGFETWTGSAFTGWTSDGTPTLAAETTIKKRNGARSASIAATGAAEGLYQALTVPINQVASGTKTITCYMWVYCTSASDARIRLSFDGGSTFTENDADHTGADHWELLKVTATIPTSATSIRVYLQVDTGVTAYFDSGWATINPVNLYTLPTTFVEYPNIVRMQYNQTEPGDTYIDFPDNGYPSTGHILHLEGMGYLSEVTTETGTVEVGGIQVEVITLIACEKIARAMAADTASQERQTYRDLARDFRDELHDRFYDRNGHLRPAIATDRQGSNQPENCYTFKKDSNGMYLEFVRQRGGIASLGWVTVP